MDKKPLFKETRTISAREENYYYYLKKLEVLKKLNFSDSNLFVTHSTTKDKRKKLEILGYFYNFRRKRNKVNLLL